MKRTTVSLPKELLARAAKTARRRRISLAALVREALGAYLDGESAWDPPRSLGYGDSRGRGCGRELGDVPVEAYGLGPG